MDRPWLSTPLWRRSFFTQALRVAFIPSERGDLLIIASGKHYTEYPSFFLVPDPSFHSPPFSPCSLSLPAPCLAPPPLALTRRHSLLHPSQAWSLSHVTTSIHLPHPHYHNLLSTRPGLFHLASQRPLSPPRAPPRPARIHHPPHSATLAHAPH